MIRMRSLASLVAGILLIASCSHEDRGGIYIFGIKGVDWSRYPDVKVHPIFPIMFFGGVVLLALGIVLIKSDIQAWQRKGKNG